MNPDTLIERVRRACDALIDAAEPNNGLLPSLVDRRTGRMLEELPEPIPGQRVGDRAHRGSNLSHDQSVLNTFYALSDALGDQTYADAGDRYLATFATHCTDTVSGLFPWGEHTFWNLDTHRPGFGPLNDAPPRPRTEGIHDHLLQAPVWLWQKLHAADPAAVERFAVGLENHWVAEPDADTPADVGDQTGATLEYNRHAYLDRRAYFHRSADRSCDFPRHIGFFLLDWAFAWIRTGRDDFRTQIDRAVDYWWPIRDESGLCLIHSRSNQPDWRTHGTDSPVQTLSLGVSMLDTAELVDHADPALARTIRERGEAFVRAYFTVAHDIPAGRFIAATQRGTGKVTGTQTLRGSQYGDHTAATSVLLVLAAYRYLHDAALLDWAKKAAARIAAEPMPEDRHILAKDAGQELEMLADVAELTGDEQALHAALTRANDYADRFLDADLPRGAIHADAPQSLDYYESQHLPGYLLHGLLRIGLLARGTGTIAPDYSLR